MSVQRTNRNGKPPGVTTALNYVRVSSDEQSKEGLSLDAQLDDCRRYAAQHGWVLGTEYQDILSGKRDDRPDYQRMLSDARQLRAEGKPVVIVVKWLHRLGRRVLERVRSREEMKALGVPLHSVAEGGEVSDLVANILASVAEEEVRQLGERVQAVNRHLARTGWARPGKCAWGYRWRKPTDVERANGAPKAVLDVDTETAPFVQEAYRRVAGGATVRSVLRWIALLPDTARGNRSLTLHAVQQVLSTPTYIACTNVDGELLPGRWPVLVDRATWNCVQDRVADHKHVPHQASKRYLVTGLLRCPQCGARMQGCDFKHRSPYYRCHGKDSGERAAVERNCNFSTKGETIHAAVLDHVSAIVGALDGQDARVQVALRRAWDHFQQAEAQDEAAPRRQALERQQDRAQERLKRAALLFVDDQIDRAGYETARDAAQADLEATLAELERLQGNAPTTNTLPALDEVLRDLGGWSTALRDGDIAAKREVLALLIDCITPVRVSFGKYDVQVTWTSLGESLHRVANSLTVDRERLHAA
jgi:site-specific DNA recombinase